MRYLNRREEFLKNYSKIVTEREKYVPEKGIESINEDSGPFANDIGWGDSLVGRLINSAIRKAKIGANLLRMKGVENRLREAMDDLLLTSGIADLDPEDKSLYSKCMITTYLIMLEEGVKKGEPMPELMNLTDAAIDAAEDEEGLEGKNELLRQLNEWKKYLEQFKDEEESQEEEGEEEEEEDLSDTTGIYLKNFSHLFKMMLIYQGIEKEKGEYYKSQALAKGAAGKTGTPTAGTSGAAGTSGGAGTSGAASTGPGSANANVGNTNKVNAQNESKLMRYEDFMKKESVAGTVGNVAGKIWKFFTGGKDEKQLDAETKRLWLAMKPLYQLFGAEKGTLEKDSELGKMLKDPSSLKGTTDYNKYKSNIDKIYTFVRSANGVNEDVHAFLGKNEQIGKAIAGIYAVTKSKADGSFMQYPGTVGEVWDELTDQIAGFNSTMSSVLKIESKWNAGDTVKWKSEKTGEEIEKEIIRVEGKKLVFKDKKGEEYTKFISEVEKVGESAKYDRYNMILEAEEGQEIAQEEEEDSQVSGWKNPNSVTKIQDWWGKNMDLKQWMMKKTEVEKVRINLEKKMAENKDAVVIQGLDPVIEVVKVFNRAYKLHTTQVIPTGRSGGRVSNKTFMEYHCFGSGSPANAGEGGGPYRNIAIFNQWEDSVNNVMKDKRYQKIFNVGTKMKVGNEFIDKAGMNLRKFMTDMLDGEELYKGGTGNEQGAQAKFLDKYFGYKDDKDGKDLYYDKSDRDQVTSLAADVEKGAVRLKLEEGKSEVSLEKTEDLENTFFALSMEGTMFYFLVQDIRGEIAYLSYSQTAYYMIDMIKRSSGTAPKLESELKVKSKQREGSTDDYEIRATKIKISDLIKDGRINVSNIKVSYLVKKKSDDGKFSNKNADSEIIQAKDTMQTKAFHIIDLNKGSVPGEFVRVNVKGNSVAASINDFGGFKEIAAAKDINDAQIFKQ